MSQIGDTIELAALVRAGATARAWDCINKAGNLGSHDPLLLCLKGRLLKDMARAATAARRGLLYSEAAAAYGEAAAKTKTSYALINAATLNRLAGSPAESFRLA